MCVFVVLLLCCDAEKLSQFEFKRGSTRGGDHTQMAKDSAESDEEGKNESSDDDSQPELQGNLTQAGLVTPLERKFVRKIPRSNWYVTEKFIYRCVYMDEINDVQNIGGTFCAVQVFLRKTAKVDEGILKRPRCKVWCNAAPDRLVDQFVANVSDFTIVPHPKVNEKDVRTIQRWFYDGLRGLYPDKQIRVADNFEYMGHRGGKTAAKRMAKRFRLTMPQGDDLNLILHHAPAM